MDFGWSKAQQELHERFLALGREVNELSPDERMPALASGGALGLCINEEHGGGGIDLVSTAYAFEALGTTLNDGGLLLAAGAHLFGVAMTIQKVGTKQQKRRYLPALADGSCLATVAATEATAGSDIASIQATVSQTTTGWKASGDKAYVSYADRAELFLFVGRNDGGRGLSCTLIPTRCPGVRPGELLDTLGLKGARLAPMTFQNCELDEEALLGKNGAGMAVFQSAMSYERALILAFRLGAMQQALDDAVSFAKNRQLGGQAIAQHQAVSHRLARMKMRLESARLMTYRAAWTLDHQPRAHAEAALAKWHVAEAALSSSLDDSRLRGASGFLDNSLQVPNLHDALGGTIHSGTSDVLATIVARWLGL